MKHMLNILIITVLALVVIAAWVISKSRPDSMVYGDPNMKQFKRELQPFYDKIYKDHILPPDKEFVKIPVFASNLQFFLYQLNNADKTKGYSQIMPIDKKDFFISAVWSEPDNDWVLSFIPRFISDDFIKEWDRGAHFYGDRTLYPDYEPIIKYHKPKL